FNHEERVELVEMLFDVAYADGELSAREIAIAEQAATAIGLTSKDTQRARAKIDERHKLQTVAPTRGP
ncbi:MAG: TerB family tellurite resistance protein, partial [Dongiaceae bacterium]